MALLWGGIAALRLAFGDTDNPSLSSSGDKLAMVRIQGVLTSSEDINTWIRKVRDDASVRGVLLRIDCPGGAVAPSQEIYAAISRLAQTKPVVASIGSVGASGGYYVAAPAQVIMANPSSITGSIGVIMKLPNFEGLMDKLGIQGQVLKSGRLKDAGSPLRPMTPEEHAQLQGLIADIHEQFVADVVAARGMDEAAVKSLADGRAFTGNQALKVGLIDKLGSFEDAVTELKALCGITERVPLVEQPKEDQPLLQRILGQVNINLNTNLEPQELFQIR